MVELLMTEADEYKWYEDTNRTMYIVNKAFMAQAFAVSLKTIDDWVRKGAPIFKEGSNGISYQIDAAPFVEWALAHQLGITIEEYRRRMVEFHRRLAKEHEVEALRAEVAELKARLSD